MGLFKSLGKVFKTAAPIAAPIAGAALGSLVPGGAPIGAVAGSALGGALAGSQADKQRQTSAAAPWGPIQPYLSESARIGFNQLALNRNKAIPGILEQAQGAQPVLDAATGQYLDTLGGNYLDNPFTEQAVQSAIKPIEQAYQRNIVPGILGRLSSRGALSSGMAERQLNAANEGFASALADTAGRIGYQNYANERQNMMGALGMAPAFQELQYQPLDVQRDAYADRGNQALRVLATLQGTPGGTNTTTSRQGGGLSGALAGGLGAGAAAYGLLGQPALFGGQ